VAAREFEPVVVTLRQGRSVTVRAIRSDDTERLQSAVRALSDESRHFRFMAALRELPPALLDLATNPRAGRDLQLVAVVGEGAAETIVAGARYSSETGSRECEFAVALVDAWRATSSRPTRACSPSRGGSASSRSRARRARP